MDKLITLVWTLHNLYIYRNISLYLMNMHNYVSTKGKIKLKTKQNKTHMKSLLCPVTGIMCTLLYQSLCVRFFQLRINNKTSSAHSGWPFTKWHQGQISSHRLVCISVEALSCVCLKMYGLWEHWWFVIIEKGKNLESQKLYEVCFCGEIIIFMYLIY